MRPEKTDIEKNKEALLRIKDATLAIIAGVLLPIPDIAGSLKLSMMREPIASMPIIGGSGPFAQESELFSAKLKAKQDKISTYP